MRTEKLTVQRVIEVSTAIEIIGDTDALEGVTAFKLGRLKKTCEEIAKLYHSAKDKETAKHKELKSKDTPNERKREIVEAINDKMRAILDLQEEIDIPELKLSEFVAKTDRTVKFAVGEGKTETREVKEGQMLVPQVFFNLIGDFITDDKNTGKFAPRRKSKLAEYLEQQDTPTEPPSIREILTVEDKK